MQGTTRAIKKIWKNEPTNEPIAWYGPIIMNTHEELRKALQDIDFIQIFKNRLP